ncbi:RND transporter [Duganella caerulea]|uniref:efflux transporter outer membrane subunit n=1 Tax=Duganella caerulea TaxID=2885762 RepID=UPI0030E74EB7
MKTSPLSSGAPLLLALTTLAGCANLRPVSLPPAAAPFQAPADWSQGKARAAPADAAALAAWWRRFNDPLLEQLVGQALQANPGIAQARATLQQARATRAAAAAGLAATVSGSGQAQRSKQDGSAVSNSYNLGFDARWEPDIFGANHYGLAASAAALQASAATLGGTQVSVAAEVARDYIDLRGAQARLAIARDNLANQLSTLEITNWRVQAGMLTSLEQQQAITAAEQAAAQLPVLEASVAQLGHALAVLCGQSPAALDALLAPPRAIPGDGAQLALSLPAATLHQRPDVRAAEFQLEAARARVGQADAARYPQFRLDGSLGLSGLGWGASGGTLLRTLLAGVTGNVLDGGASQAQLDLQRGALAQAQAGYLSTVLGALQEVEDALASLTGERARLEHLRLAADAAESAALLARQRYASGLVDFQTVLETQRALYASQDGVAVTSADLGGDLVRLYKALGGGWQPDGEGAATKQGSAP